MAAASQPSQAHRLSAFEELIASVPAVLEALPDESRRAVAATSWAALLSTLEHTPFVLNVFDDIREKGEPAVLLGLAKRMKRRSAAVPGSVRLGHPYGFERPHATFAADDAAALVTVGERLATWSTAYFVIDLEKFGEKAEAAGVPLRMRTFSGTLDNEAKSRPPLGQSLYRPATETMLRLLAHPRTQQDLRALRLYHFGLNQTAGDLAQHLAKVSNLERLEITRSFHMKGVGEICPALQGLRRLRKVELSVNTAWCPVFGPKSEFVAAMKLLRVNASIEDFHLGGFGGLSKDEAVAIEEMLRTNTTLRRLGLCWNSSSRPPWSPKACEVGEAIGAGLRSNETLAYLSLSGGDFFVSDGGVAFAQGLAKNRTLQELRLSDTMLDAEGLASLGPAVAQSDALSLIHLRGEPGAGRGVNAFAQALKERSSVTSLTLIGCCVCEDGVSGLAEAIGKDGALGKTLRELDLSSNDDVAAEEAVELGEALRSNETLRTLCLDHCSIKDAGAAAIASALAHGCKVERLHMRNCGVRDSGAEALAEALRTNTTLRTLSLDRNDITRVGGGALAEALGAGSALEELRLTYMPSRDRPSDCMNDGVARAFVRAKKRGARLRVIEDERKLHARKSTLTALQTLGCTVVSR
ncbi:unnamed protein product [Pedinophyceae sp. YPF-701]|nr:unnamed protein product [Pedinophyceae sp. YPF-701]